MGLRILIAEDNRDEVTSLATVLEHEGHEVRKVYRGDAVLGEVRTYKPDVVLLDIGMPGETGFEIARHMRDELGKKRPLLIAVTGWKQTSAKVLGKIVGFDHYVTKPYAIDDLLGLLSPLRRTA